MHFISLLQQVEVAEKIKTAPDSSYQIGVVIGSFIPFVILIGIAYWMYNRAKKRDENGY
jgi:nitrate reductase gamma subunit